MSNGYVLEHPRNGPTNTYTEAKIWVWKKNSEPLYPEICQQNIEQVFKTPSFKRVWLVLWANFANLVRIIPKEGQSKASKSTEDLHLCSKWVVTTVTATGQRKFPSRIPPWVPFNMYLNWPKNLNPWAKKKSTGFMYHWKQFQDLTGVGVATETFWFGLTKLCDWMNLFPRLVFSVLKLKTHNSRFMIMSLVRVA